MDPSTEYKKNMTKKSKKLTHEERRLDGRAGTVYNDVMGVTRRRVRNWAGGYEGELGKRFDKLRKDKSKLERSVREGK